MLAYLDPEVYDPAEHSRQHRARDRQLLDQAFDEVIVEKYSLPPSELGARFLDLEKLAEQMYPGTSRS